ncbi:hypothetical protein DL95DRAFT_400080 [Leptodontidium sp. 2 PMI_412]|nr:hypothetical protein DL95DRAFT_400080 [Leptodontidium sp. 2 PMI_412]
MLDGSDLDDTNRAMENTGSNSDAPTSSNDAQALPIVITTASMEPTFTLFPKLPAELRLHTLKMNLPGRSLKLVEVRRDEIMFAWDPNSEQWVINVPFQPLLHVSRESRHECLKHYVVTKPQEKYHSCVYYPFGNMSLVFRYGVVEGSWWGFINWQYEHNGDLLQNIRHLVIELDVNEGEVLYEPVGHFPGNVDFWELDWPGLTGLESFGATSLDGRAGAIEGFTEEEDTDEHRKWQAELIGDLEATSTNWNPKTRVHHGSFIFAG